MSRQRLSKQQELWVAKMLQRLRPLNRKELLKQLTSGILKRMITKRREKKRKRRKMEETREKRDK